MASALGDIPLLIMDGALRVRSELDVDRRGAEERVVRSLGWITTQGKKESCLWLNPLTTEMQCCVRSCTARLNDFPNDFNPRSGNSLQFFYGSNSVYLGYPFMKLL